MSTSKLNDRGGLPALLTVKTTCEELGIGRTTLYELIRDGAIRTVRIGIRGVRVPAIEIQRYIDERLSATGVEANADR